MASRIISPITTEAEFYETLEYLAEKVGDLGELVCGTRYPVSILKIFATDQREYEFVEALVNQHGTVSEVSSSNSHYVQVTNGLETLGVPITLLGVRRPDNSKTERGCGDYELADFQRVAQALLARETDYARPVENAHGLGMVELQHPNFNVLGYIVPAE